MQTTTDRSVTTLGCTSGINAPVVVQTTTESDRCRQRGVELTLETDLGAGQVRRDEAGAGQLRIAGLLSGSGGRAGAGQDHWVLRIAGLPSYLGTYDLESLDKCSL